ncbi:unnamed protein product [Mytilus edulis]|uniref:Caspase family p20 domain-containing protein n=1 Tax=Mytilus edulis TaxID=6550 RepID=A0A8S3Q7Q7_MYTED|nr:unnamed protein product [Mytilus edulis]
MKCTKCGADVAPSDKFCGACGQKVEIDDHGDKIKDVLVVIHFRNYHKKFDSSKQPQSIAKVIQIPPKENNSGSEREDDAVLKDNPGGTRYLQKRHPKRKCNSRTSSYLYSLYFQQEKFNLSNRDNAGDDKHLMSESWEQYGCEILAFEEKKSEFYQKNLANEIAGKLNEMGTIDYFVFVLSTHGDESHEVNLKEKDNPQYHHYFYTKDDRYRTQNVIDAIGEIPELDGILKMFFIQACRSRFMNAEIENQDIGHTIPVLSSTDEEKHSGHDQPDAVGHMSVEDNKIAQSFSKTKSVDVEDAKGYMPPPEKEDDSTSQKSEIKTMSTTREKRTGEVLTSTTIPVPNAVKTEVEEIVEIPTTVAIPHCDDCVVVFASMTGKYAYSRLYDSTDGGGWMIRALHSTMIKQQKPGDIVYIPDILTGINREISRKENTLKLKSNHMNENIQRMTYSSYLSVLLTNVDQKIKKEETSQQLLLKVKEYFKQGDMELFEGNENIELLKVKEVIELEDLKLLKVKENPKTEDFELLKITEGLKLLKVNEDLKILRLKVDVEQEIYKLDDEIKVIRDRVEEFIGEVTIKAQSCFFHNLAFEDEHMKLKYQNKVQST